MLLAGSGVSFLVIVFVIVFVIVLFSALRSSRKSVFLTKGTTVMHISEQNIAQVKALCKEHRVKRLSAFGSVLTDRFSSSSDIDFVVDFDENDPIKYTDLYFQLKEKLEQIFKRQIDLIEERGIRNSFFRKELDASKVVIYG